MRPAAWSWIGGSAAGVLALLMLLPDAVSHGAEAGEPIRVGSKKFTENVVLGEVAAQLMRDAGFTVEHQRELGGSRILWNALLRGDLDVYPDYTGTLREEILAERGLASDAELRQALGELGLVAGRPLGFDNTYAVGVRRDLAERLSLSRISDLVGRPELTFGFANEFLRRADGWPGLRERYRLPQADVRGLDHDLAYRGLVAGDIQATDLYSTDAEIAYYDLVALEDDLGFFPEYQAVLLWRQDLPTAAVAALRLPEGRISAETMVAMNARAKLDRVPERQVAAAFLEEALGVARPPESAAPGPAARILRRTWEHLLLVALSLGAAVLIAIPLGIAAARWPVPGRLILGAAGVLQTIPSLALLVFMIPLLGIGAPPALAALFLYSLLPIVRNTHTGLTGIPVDLRESAAALGLPWDVQLRRIELPLAAPSILAGIKTSAVINVGTATLGALIGAGGYGQPILTGIRLDDVGLILEGAVPAAALALLAQGLFDAVERIVVPRGLRL